MTQHVTVRMGESAKSFLQRYTSGVRINRQPAGIDFYSMDWDRPPHATVVIEHGAHTVEFPHSLGLQMSEDQGEHKAEGFREYSVYVGITDTDTLSHAEARDRIYDLVNRIAAGGWQTIVPRSRPRLNGKARLDYALGTSTTIGLPVRPMASLDEWMRLENLSEWSFYADGVYLSLDFQRQPAPAGPPTHGAYLVTVRLKSATEHFRGYVPPEDREHWRELLPAQLDKLYKIRALTETELRAQGVPIDDTYRDPPVPQPL